MTLDEWKQMQEKERVKATFELRKPGEGEKKGMWKNTKVLKKTEDEDDEQFAARRVSWLKLKICVADLLKFWLQAWFTPTNQLKISSWVVQ